MSELITRLRSLNRKERFILLSHALGGHTFTLDGDFRERLGVLIGVPIPRDAFVAMDYHLDWLQVALFLSRMPAPPQLIPQGAVLGEGQEDINSTQMDIDLLVAFDHGARTHLVLLEAKVETSWSNRQMRRKAKRLDQIFADRTDGDVAQPHVVLLSPTRPRRLQVGTWPAWMKHNNEPMWMELPRPDGLQKVIRCDDAGHASGDGGSLRMVLMAGSASRSASESAGEDGRSTTFMETVDRLIPLMDQLRNGEERSWQQYGETPPAGVYALYEHGNAVYVGRSNGMRARIREHGADSSDRYSATFAFKLLRKELGEPAGAAKDIEATHREEFRKQRERVREMTFRAVPIEDQLEQTLFETYAILELGTYPEHNDFDTH